MADADFSDPLASEDEQRERCLDLYLDMGRMRSLASVAHRYGVSLGTLRHWAALGRWEVLGVQRDKEDRLKIYKDGSDILEEGHQDRFHSVLLRDLGDLSLQEARKLLALSASTDAPVISPPVLIRLTEKVTNLQRLIQGQTTEAESGLAGGLSDDLLMRLEDELLRKATPEDT
jgi:hypothetical protein